MIGKENLPPHASERDFRDPRVFRSGEYYYAIIGSKDTSGNGQVLCYRSQDLLNWGFASVVAKSGGEVGSTWECPDLFRLGNRDVLLVSPQHSKGRAAGFLNTHSSVYMVGDLDPDTWHLQYDRFFPVDYGFDFYAPQTTIDNWGRRILMAWMNKWETADPLQSGGHGWSGAMTLPREVIIVGDKLYFRPVAEIAKYRQNEFALTGLRLIGEKTLETSGDSYEIMLSAAPEDASEFGLRLRLGATEETVLSYNTLTGVFRFNRDKSGRGPKGVRTTRIGLSEGRLKLRIFVDRCSLEVFLNDGEKVMTGRIYPGKQSLGIGLFSSGGWSTFDLKKWDLSVKHLTPA